jgi:hypothetical protein
MDNESTLQFSVTLWPGIALPEPEVARWKPINSTTVAEVREKFADTTGPVSAAARSGWHWRGHAPLPELWVLHELRDADLRDDQALTALLDRYGWIPHDRVAADADAFHQPIPLFDRDPSAELPVPGPDEHLNRARVYLTAAQALAAIWADAAQGKPVSKAAWRFFAAWINAGLRSVTAYVRQADEDPNEPSLADFGRQVDLFSGACVQLYNLVCEGHWARVCKNCGRPFPYQRGAAKHRQFRIDSVYCSVACGNAYRQREHRRTLRAKKNRGQL